MDDENIKKYTILRNQYYSSGRELLFNQSFSMAGIMLGYSIETSIKLLLILNHKLSNKLKNTHNINNLFQELLKIYPNLNISDDLILFINDRLDQRYPDAQNRVTKFHIEENRLQDFSLEIIHYYDELFYQLDKLCWLKTNDATISSSLYRTLKTLNTYPSRAIFHLNYSLYNRMDKLYKLLDISNDQDELKYFNENQNQLLDFNFLFITQNPKIATHTDISKFNYVRWTQDKNGIPYVNLKLNNTYTLR